MAQRSGTVRKVLATTQGKTYTIALVTLFMIVLMFFLAIRPAFLSITDQNEQNQLKREYLQELTNKENALKSLAQQESQYTEEIELLNKFLPGGRNDELIIANISRMAEQNGCDLQFISFGVTEIPEDPDLAIHVTLGMVPTTFATVCTLDRQQLILGNIESFPIPIRITDIGFTESKVQIEGTPTVYDMNFAAEYYFWNAQI